MGTRTFVRVPIRVLVAERSVLRRDGLARLVDATPDLELVGCGPDLDGPVGRVEPDAPDVVVTGVPVPPPEIVARVAVLVVAADPDPAQASTLLAHGASGRAYLVEERLTDVVELVDAIRTVASGGTVIDPSVVEALVPLAPARRSADLDRLTRREGEILGEMATGKSNAAIARSLVLSERAIEKHTNAIFAKLGLRSCPDRNRRVSAVLAYLGVHG